MRLVKLDWQGLPTWVNPEHVVSVQKEGDGSRCRVRLDTSGEIQFMILHHPAETIVNLLLKGQQP